MLPDAAIAHYRRQQRLSTLAVATARRSWLRIGSGNWDSVVAPLFLLVTAAQKSAAGAGAAYVPEVLGELNVGSDAVGSVAVPALIGIASDGRQLDSLLSLPVRYARSLIVKGMPDTAALAQGGRLLDRIVATQVADAGRAAESVAMVARPKVGGFVRMLNLPSCPRCAILAGKFYKWNTGFKRHPQCDCVHIPSSEDVAGDLRTDPMAAFRSGNIKGLSAADAKAIRDGADLNQVVNASRGMSTAQRYGQKLKVTTEGSTRRGIYSQQRRRIGNASEARTAALTGEGTRRYARVEPRVRPESIYKMAGDDRKEAIRLLTLNGFIVT